LRWIPSIQYDVRMYIGICISYIHMHVVASKTILGKERKEKKRKELEGDVKMKVDMYVVRQKKKKRRRKKRYRHINIINISIFPFYFHEDIIIVCIHESPPSLPSTLV
jgi:hypothetical protein